VAFYPLYPLLIRALSLGIFWDVSSGHLALCGLLISAVASLAAVTLLDRLYGIYLDTTGRHLGLALWVFCPTAVFLSVGYAESLFIALVLGGFLRSSRRDWLGAGALIGLSCVTRPFGAVAYAALLAEYVGMRKRSGGLSRPWLAGLGLALPALAISIHVAYQALYLQDPLASVHAEQKNWNQHPLAPWSFPSYISRVITVAIGLRGYEYVIWFNYLCLMFGLILSARVFGSVRLSFGLKVYTGLTLLSILCRSSEMSVARFLMGVFPLFIVLAEWGSRGSPARALMLLLSFVTLDTLSTVLFVSNRPFF
jgi:hypothetical protein